MAYSEEPNLSSFKKIKNLRSTITAFNTNIEQKRIITMGTANAVKTLNFG
jgi:hypothetical protein